MPSDIFRSDPTLGPLSITVILWATAPALRFIPFEFVGVASPHLVGVDNADLTNIGHGDGPCHAERYPFPLDQKNPSP